MRIAGCLTAPAPAIGTLGAATTCCYGWAGSDCRNNKCCEE